jgi:uncharacterized iron-regulated membrane protein
MGLFRRIIFWSHLVAGVSAAVLILLMCVTGVLLTYEKQMITWSDREFRLAAVPGGAERIPLSTLIQQVAETQDGFPSGITVEADPAAPVALQYSGQPARIVFANPYTGEVLGTAGTGMRKLMSDLRGWHRWLAVSGEGRANARAVTGAANVVFLFIVLSGIYLWFPKAFTWKHLRPIIWFRGGLQGKARDFNWHNAAGFWCAIPLAAVVFSAVFISYPWAREALVKTLDGAAPAAQSQPATASANPDPEAKDRKRVGLPPALNLAWNRALEQSPDWRNIRFSLPKTEADPLAFSVSRGDGGQPQYRGTLQVNADTGEVIRWEPFEALSAGMRGRLFMRFLHTGEYYGVAGQTIAGIASAGGALLVYSGIALSLRRFASWLRRRRQRRESEPLAKAA